MTLEITPHAWRRWSERMRAYVTEDQVQAFAEAALERGVTRRAAVPVPGDKVFFTGRKGALKVVRLTHLNGEAAVELAPSANEPPVRTVAIADLVRADRGWRERWRQEDLFN